MNYEDSMKEFENLPNELSTLTAEIFVYKKLAGMAILKIGELIKQAKERILQEQPRRYEKWVENTLQMSPGQARKYIAVFEESENDPIFRSISNEIESLDKLYSLKTLPMEVRYEAMEIPSKGLKKKPVDMTTAELREAKRNRLLEQTTISMGELFEEKELTEDEKVVTVTDVERFLRNIIRELWRVAFHPGVGMRELESLSHFSLEDQQCFNKIFSQFPSLFHEILELFQKGFAPDNIVEYLHLKDRAIKFLFFRDQMGWYVNGPLPEEVLIESYKFESSFLDELDQAKNITDEVQFFSHLKLLKVELEHIYGMFRFTYDKTTAPQENSRDRDFKSFIEDSVESLHNLNETIKMFLMKGQVGLHHAVQIGKLPKDQQEIMACFITREDQIFNEQFETIFEAVQFGYKEWAIREMLELKVRFNKLEPLIERLGVEENKSFDQFIVAVNELFSKKQRENMIENVIKAVSIKLQEIEERVNKQIESYKNV